MAATYNYVGSAIADGSSTRLSITNIPQTDSDLLVIGMFRNASANYTWTYLNGGQVSSDFDSRIFQDLSGGSSPAGYASAWFTTGASVEFAPFYYFITDYSSTSTFKTVNFRWCGYSENTNGSMGIGALQYDTTAPITSFGMGPNNGSNVLAGSKMSIYTIKKA